MQVKRKNPLVQTSKGSLTVEAALVLPLFLFAFLLFLFMLKVVYIQAALDHAVKETGREIAAVAYPLSFFNEWEDELLAEGEENTFLTKELKGRESSFLPVYGEYIGDIFADGFVEGNLGKLWAITNGLSGQDGRSSIENSIIKKLSAYYYDLQEDSKYVVVDTLLFKHLETYELKAENLALCLVNLPQSKNSYNNNKDDPRYQESGLFPELDFSKEDVVIQAQYNVTIPLPFLTDNTVLLKSTAVERAWLHGSNGVYTNRDEKGYLETLQNEIESTVYITRTGEKYHLSNCRYLRKSKIPISLEEAKKGYQPCKVCRP